MNRFFRYKIDHILFWILTILFHGFIRTELLEKAGAGYFVLELLVRNGLLAIVIYTNLLLIIPQYYHRSKHGVGVLLTIASVAGYVLLKNAHDVYVYGYVLDVAAQREFSHDTFYNLSIVLFYLTFSVTLYLSKQWYVQQQLIRKIELEKINTELEYLKAQINPHFLFNSINTIFFQIDKHNTAARDTLTRFSDMLRYQLYECNGTEIPIEKEVSYLKNYVALQRLRKDENYDIQFTREDSVRDFSIAPLLMIPFIENAFKHVSHFTNTANRIHINLSRDESWFRLDVYNTRQSIGKTHENGGIGLKNTKRRLDLLYPDKHELIIEDDISFFSVTLRICVKD